MGKVQVAHSFSHVPWFFRVERTGRTFADCTKPAMSGANITTQHEGRRPIRPAFKDVRAPGFLADGMKVQPLNQLKDVVLICGIAQTDLEPVRFGLTHLLSVADDS